MDKLGGPIPFVMDVPSVLMSSRPPSHMKCSPSENRMSFPTTRAVLWNRNPNGNATKVTFLKNDMLKLIVNERTLHLAYKQLQVHGSSDFDGFFIGELDFNADEGVSVRVDRFDPGRNGQIKSGSDVRNIRIPTAVIPGDLCIPVVLHHGKAFVDHVSTETHTVSEFIKTLQVLESWCSRNDKLDVNNFLSMKIKCCFQKEDDEILAFITCGCVTIEETVKLIPIHAIPIIQTALARNLIGPTSLSEVQSQVKTGFVTMDQTRKLLLLLETDPKAYTLPLVGIWISGVNSLSAETLWASCIRFIHSKHIEERVFAPPNCYVAVVYMNKIVNPQFYEFSSNSGGDDDVHFAFLSSCEGIQLNLIRDSIDATDYSFNLTSQTSGLLSKHFEEALSATTRCNRFGQDDTQENAEKDDSLPHAIPSPSPHVQALQGKPSVPDLSLCESFNLDDGGEFADAKQEEKNEVILSSKPINSKKPSPQNIKFPRQTKASLARIELNKQGKEIKNTKHQTKNRLAINFKSTTSKTTERKDMGVEVEAMVKIKRDSNIVTTSDIDKFEDSTPRLPVQIRSRMSNIDSVINNWPTDGSHDESILRESNHDLGSSSNQSYHPENYSDVNDYHSFVIESGKNIIDEKGPELEHNVEATWKNSYTRVSPVVNDRNITQGICSEVAKESNAKISHNENYSIKKNVSKDSLSTNKETLNCLDKSSSASEEVTTNDDSTKEDLYNLVLAQQKQLSNLQTQLELFMSHQKISEKPSEKDTKVNEDGIRSIQEEQQKQLNHLQEQVQFFLQQASPISTANTSTQCNGNDNLTATSIGVNTGESLLWPGIDMTSTDSSTAPRGLMQARGMNDDSPKEKKKCSCCQHCHRKPRKNTAKSSEKHHNHANVNNINNNFQTPSLSELATEDINGSIFNDTASSAQTLSSSLRAVDIPVFDDSQEECSLPEKNAALQNNWDQSPMLGESASMLIEQRRQEAIDEGTTNNDQIRNNEEGYNLLDNKEFYSQMMGQVQKMMEAQNMPEAISPSAERESSVDYTDNDKVEKKTESVVEEERINHVREVTVNHLQQIIKQPDLSPTFKQRPRSASTSAIPTYPKINYVSMSVDETFYENPIANIDDITSKYISNEYMLLQERSTFKNKTVKFGGVYEWQTISHARNMSVNISCNMSVASRKYLQKYDLVENNAAIVKPLSDINGRTFNKDHIEHKRKMKEKENILDFNKIRNLPKLL